MWDTAAVVRRSCGALTPVPVRQRDSLAQTSCAYGWDMSSSISAARRQNASAVARLPSACSQSPNPANVVAWALVDARPLAGLAVYAVVAAADAQLLQLRFRPAGINVWTLHGWQPFLPALVGLLILPLAVWRMRRQSAL